MKGKAYLSIRIDPAVHEKFRSIAAYEGRSMSGQLVYLVNRYIREFEDKNGPINLLED